MAADSEFFEAIKSVGAIVGLITGGFIVFDRMIRNRPYLSFRPREATQSSIDLLFHNTSDEGLIVEKVRVNPAITCVAFGDDLKSTVAAAATPHFEDDRTAYVGPRSSVALPLVSFSDWDAASDTSKITITIHWRTSSSRRMWAWPISISRTVGEIKKLEKSAKPNSIT
jgi:hypothetical protein